MDSLDSTRQRRTQRDYSMGFKLQVVAAVEKGDMTYKQAQKIKRLERELEDERLRNLLMNEVVDILDAEYGTGLRKKYIAKERDAFKNRKG